MKKGSPIAHSWPNLNVFQKLWLISLEVHLESSFKSLQNFQKKKKKKTKIIKTMESSL